MREELITEAKKLVCALTHISSEKLLTTGCQFQSLPVANENRVTRQTNDMLPLEIRRSFTLNIVFSSISDGLVFSNARALRH